MKGILAAFAVVLTVNCHAQIGKTFPEMKAESLTYQPVNIPGDLSDKYTLICLASSSKAEEYMGRWFSPVYNNFIYKPETPGLFSFTYDIYVYFVPMFTGVKRAAYKTTMKKVEASASKVMKPYILFYEGKMSDYKDSLEMEDKRVPYFYVLDPSGKIVYQTSGVFTDKKMQEIVNAVASAIKH